MLQASESANKSESLNLGVILADENSTEGMIKVLKSLKIYCPTNEENKFVNIVSRGDGLTGNLMNIIFHIYTVLICSTDFLNIAKRITTTQRLTYTSQVEDEKLSHFYPGIGNINQSLVLCLTFETFKNFFR